ncbi:MAG: DUF2088 domain-containing protein [Acidobacteriia bacterium]|nr:DUF2088 domain-containing protein [Terriglobia bacterium]
MRIQKLVPVVQRFPSRALADVSAAVREEMEAAAWTRQVPAGSRIAVGVGSRGISNMDVIAKAAVEFWKSRGVQPFIVPVMGSHGAATAQGQADVLAHYGIDESTMGVPIESSLEVVRVGTTPEGIEVSMDRRAFESDGVMLCGRVKWHTDFEGSLESGIHKMMAIGLGKWEGAKRYHSWALKIGMGQVIRSVGSAMLATGKMLGGLAILEDAYHDTAEVHALGADGMAGSEEELLRRVKGWKPNLPVKEVDLLILDEIGKDISGAGMDTKVVNRGGGHGPNNWQGVPTVHRIFVRDLSGNTYGNAIGMGLADIVHDRLVKKVDFQATWVNALTSSVTSPGFTPLHFATDRECLERVLPTCGKLDPGACSILWIRNTLDLSYMLASENLLEELAANDSISLEGEAAALPFDPSGDLVSPFEASAARHTAA